MTGAERQRAYRDRLLDDQLFEHLQVMAPLALRERLSRALKELEDAKAGRTKIAAPFEDLRQDMGEGAQYDAEAVWREVGRRYGFKVGKKRSTSD